MPPIEDHYLSVPAHLGFAVLTVSDTRDEESDRGGGRLVALIEAAGHRMAGRELVRDILHDVRDATQGALGHPTVDVLLVTGGTGVSPRDVTVEAIVPLFDKELAGFGEIFRALSYTEIGPAAMLSRATAGVIGGKAVFLLPGSPAALELAMTKLVIPEIGHLIAQARRSA
jgi:molybdenum cofactor biosynthesis protein B